MSDSVVIRVENVSKQYLVGHLSNRLAGHDTLRDALARHARSFARKAADLHERNIIRWRFDRRVLGSQRCVV